MSAADLISRYYAAFNAKNWQAMLDCLDDAVRHDVNEGDARQGKARFAEFLAHMDHCYDEQLTDIVVLTHGAGAHAAAEFTVHGTYKQTDEGLPPAQGQRYVLPAGAFFDVEGEKITRVTTYYNLRRWLAQIERPGAP